MMAMGSRLFSLRLIYSTQLKLCLKPLAQCLGGGFVVESNKMPTSPTPIDGMHLNQELERILTILQADFEHCYELTRTFGNLPKAPGIYAIRHQAAILYIGKAADIRRRFQGGHKALSIVLMEDLSSKDVRIAATPVEEFEDAIELLEARLLQRVRPPYNVQYPSRAV
jgi:hypothetical protein